MFYTLLLTQNRCILQACPRYRSFGKFWNCRIKIARKFWEVFNAVNRGKKVCSKETLWKNALWYILNPGREHFLVNRSIYWKRALYPDFRYKNQNKKVEFKFFEIKYVCFKMLDERHIRQSLIRVRWYGMPRHRVQLTVY